MFDQLRLRTLQTFRIITLPKGVTHSFSQILAPRTKKSSQILGFQEKRWNKI